MKDFYSELKEVWVPQTKQSVHLKSSKGGGGTFSDSMSEMARIFIFFLNVPGDLEPEALGNIQQRSGNTILDEKLTMDEF